MKKQVFDKGLSVLAMQFPEKVFDAGIMWDFLKDLTDEQYGSAIKEIVASSENINKATNIIAVIRSKAICRATLTAGEAWGEVMRQVSKVGSYNIPKFSSVVIQKCVDAIGWRNICLSEMPAVERAHFLKIYDVISERNKNRVLSDPVKLLIGNTVNQIGLSKKIGV